MVPGDAKALTLTDLNDDGWPDFVVSRTDGPLLAFQNERVASRRSVRISLRGMIGNEPAIGARVTLALTDGTLLTNEIAAGSGYLSQSVADCFFGYTESNPPLLLRVRWPTGESSEQVLTAVPHHIELTAPGR